MKRLISAIALAAVILSSCSSGHRTKGERLLGNYAVVEIPAPDLSGITDNGKEVLNLYRFAADEADKIYWKQYFGDKSVMEAVSDPALREYALINYGPWDRINGKPFIEGYGQRPAGACFYPADMTSGEFDALDDPAKDSPYTLITRSEDGSLKTVWYHDAYAENIDKIANYLTAAADITIKPSVRNYLLKKIEGLRNDDYYESDKAWLDMTDSKMDLVIGPNEASDDALYGKKASYGAYVLLKNLDRTEDLSKLCARLPEFQQMLPVEPEYKAFVPGSESNIFSCNVIYYGGYTNAGFKVIAINFPYDAKVQEELGTRTILFDNVIRDKFNRTVFPVGTTLFESEQQAHLDANAFYWTIVFREVAKGLGVKETVNGKGSVAEAIGNEALTFEKAKSNVIGAWLCRQLVARHELSGLLQPEDVLTTFVANVIRSARFGNAEATGKANVMIYNYLVDNGAIFRQESGRYHIDYAKLSSAIETMCGDILRIQATGDAEAAASLVGKYSGIPGTLKADIQALEMESVPVDVRFTYGK